MRILQIQRIQTTCQNRWSPAPVEVSRALGGENLWFTRETFQTVEGFGGCFNELGWLALQEAEPSQREAFFDMLFSPDQMNISLWRVPIGASDFALKWYSHNETEGDFEMEHFSISRDEQILLPYLKAAQKRRKGEPVTVFASPWSPPTWMKNPPVCNYGNMIMEPRYLKAYALYFVKFIQAYEAHGIHVDQVHVQNEPVSSQKFPSCIWTGEQMALFIGEYLGPAFQEHGITAEIWLGTLNGQENDGRLLYTGFDNYANLVMNNPKAARYIKGISYQWAGKNTIHQTVASFPQLRYLHSEVECGDGENSWAYAEYVFTLLWRYFSAGVCGNVYWNMALKQGGESSWGWRQNSFVTVSPDGAVTYQPEFYVFRHFSQFVKPGAVRLGLKGVWNGTALAFQNPDGSRVLVAQNGLDVQRELAFQIGEQVCRMTLEPHSWNTVVME